MGIDLGDRRDSKKDRPEAGRRLTKKYVCFSTLLIFETLFLGFESTTFAFIHLYFTFEKFPFLCST